MIEMGFMLLVKQMAFWSELQEWWFKIRFTGEGIPSAVVYGVITAVVCTVIVIRRQVKRVKKRKS